MQFGPSVRVEIGGSGVVNEWDEMNEMDERDEWDAIGLGNELFFAGSSELLCVWYRV